MEECKCRGSVYLSRKWRIVVNKDMPELGITCGNALYSISSSNMIFVEQRDNSVNFEIEVDQNELTIFFMGHKYWELTK